MGIASPAQLEALWHREDGVARHQVRLRSRALADLVDAGLLAAESADLLYHWLVVLAAAGVELDAVAAKLEAREGVSGHAEKAARKG